MKAGGFMELTDFFSEHSEAAVAFSGGADSSYLLFAAAKYAKRVRAYYVKTAFQPFFELEDALRLAREIGADMRVLCLDVLGDERIAANPPDRCYHCKRRIFEAIAEAARRDGFTLLLDGTNASDDEGDRPGMRALRELGVLSPLRLCGLTKARVRELSREAGLFTWDKPAYACLATRAPSDYPITAAGLSRTEACESFMAGLGFADFRIRTRDGAAVISVTAGQRPLLEENMDIISERLLREYSEGRVDPEDRHEQ